MVFSKLYDKANAKSKGSPKETTNRESHSQSKKHKRKRATNHQESENASAKRPNLTDDLESEKKSTTTTTTTTNDRPTKRRRSMPTEEALQLSEKLKELSRQKRLEEALALYQNPANNKIRDGHHACIIIDCCARCGRIDEGEKLYEEWKTSGKVVNIETKTALIKGLAHSGQMAKAYAIFSSMCSSQARADRPNVRTVNTILRGCLWSASNVDKDGIVTGGVVTAENVWSLCRDLQEKDSKSVFFDVSSYEYSISLLCQALRTKDAMDRIDECKAYFKIESASSDIPQSLSETMALSYLALARAFTTIGDVAGAKEACNAFSPYFRSSRDSLKKGGEHHTNESRYAVKQGKESKGNRREKSNSLYRNHRMNEAESEIGVILELIESKGIMQSPRQLARRLVTRLLVLSGGGSTDAKQNDDPQSDGSSRTIQSRYLNTLFFSYGLQQVLEAMNVSMKEGTTFLKRKDCNRILGSIGLQGGIARDDGILDIQRIFRVGIGETKKKEKKQSKRKGRLEIELGSGFGDWIVNKARQDPDTNFIAVEMRADRVWQTFARTCMLAGTTPVDNLCIVGAESASFLSHQIEEGSVSTIYINHPEPPTQLFGADSYNLELIMNGGSEPAHMITSHMIRAAAGCLSRFESSRLVIVTDNKWYGRLLCATLVKVMRSERNMLFPVALGVGFKHLEGFPIELTGSGEHVVLYEGQPNAAIGHPRQNDVGQKGATYFDRLWRSGAGTHSDKLLRYIIVASRGKSN
jgi:pentatricopeptide repeat protein